MQDKVNQQLTLKMQFIRSLQKPWPKNIIITIKF